MSKKQWLKQATGALERIQEHYPCARYDNPVKRLLGAQTMMLALPRPASISGDELSALFNTFFDVALSAECTDAKPCSKCRVAPMQAVAP